MKTTPLVLAAALAAISSAVTPSRAEMPEAGMQAAHPLNFMFGEWVGRASGTSRNGEPFELVQTERVGPMLNGAITVIEGRGYAADGKLAFNAFAVVSRKTGSDEWEIRSYSRGNAGTFPFKRRENGYVWTIPAGPSAVIRYTATFKGGTWHQIGERVPASGKPKQIFEMTLQRTGDSTWPAAGHVTPPRGR